MAVSKRAAAASVLTANRLDDGRIVFLDFEGAWSESIDIAVVARTAEEVGSLEARGAFDAAQNLIVEPYLVEVRETGGRLEPVRQRERVRARGPSILDDVPGYVAPSPTAAHTPHPDPLPMKNGKREAVAQVA